MASNPSPDEIEVTLLGRGFGESVVIHALGGDWIVIDSLLDKNGSSAPLEYLKEIGVAPESVKTVVATHWHDDHIGGISELIRWAAHAKIVMPIVKTYKELNEFIQAQKPQGTDNVPGGAHELAEIVRAVLESGRPKPVHCQADVTIFRKKDPGTGIPVILYALSPVPEDVNEFIVRLGESAKDGSLSRRLSRFAPNDISVATWLSFGDEAVLLGADLEVSTDQNRGWHAVVSSTTRPLETASVYKVAHHGSETGDHDDIWSKLLTRDPIALVAPFNRTPDGLPTKRQQTRITSKSKESHVTNITPFRKYKDTESLNRATLQASNMGLRPGHSEMGRVTLRKSVATGSSWNVEYSGGANPLSRFVARG